MNRLTAIGFASLVAYGILLAAKWDGAPAPAANGSSEVVAADPAPAPGTTCTFRARSATPRPRSCEAALCLAGRPPYAGLAMRTT